MNMEILDKALAVVRERLGNPQPTAGLILGSGWGDVLESFEIEKTLPYEEIPGLGKTGVVGHSGRLILARGAGISTLIFQGRRHYYEGEGWTPVALPVYVLKQLGVSWVLLTNAAGGVRADLTPGSLMVLSDHVNNMGTNPLIGPHHPAWGPRFPDLSHAYDAPMRSALARAGAAAGLNVSEGVYLASTGPFYETPAEIRAYRTLGADAVGMSTVPETLLANAAGLRVAGLSCITNSAAGISAHPLSHEEVTETSRQTMPKMKAMIAGFWKEMAHA
ncbi:MAG TPA: purine-nucleoside phosphorylase [Kiritimatiellia bacterium]|nr:purine-nucleoside phosphorylase [Kiritimatiellia bacterium]HMO98416.1 purine-nucleoside phosphorylase [Kiritimatiellia bacterium]HMP95834.1 purine-nucleoside phosphorylase [Kiritimatiellia bacterium]